MKEVFADELLELSVTLAGEKDREQLLKKILLCAIELANCDGGTIFILKDNKLEFNARFTKSLAKFDKENDEKHLPSVELKLDNICAYAILKRTTVNVPDAYKNNIFDFSGPKKYDEMLNYKTISVLATPLENNKSEVIGAMQLINAFGEAGNIVPFDKECENMLSALASLAAICISNVDYVSEIENVLEHALKIENVRKELDDRFNLTKLDIK